MGWKKQTLGRLTGVDWSDWLLRTDKSVDPYLVWADLTGGASFAAREAQDSDADRKWPFIVELTKQDLPTRHFDAHGKPVGDVPWIFALMDIPGVYQETDPLAEEVRWGIKSRYITAQVRPCDVEMLMCSEHVCRAQLGLPRIREMRGDALPIPDRRADGLQPRVVVGIIDDGFGFAHPHLLDHEGLPRTQYLWDQDGAREANLQSGIWSKPGDLGYGAELVSTMLDKAVAGKLPDSDGLWGPYRSVRYGRFRLDPSAHSSAPEDADQHRLPIESMLRASHGHSIADLAAGFPSAQAGGARPPPAGLTLDPRDAKRARETVLDALNSALQLQRRRPDDSGAVAALDSADQWHLVLVQLPVRTVADTSGGSLAVHVLDGIHYVLERARCIPFVDAPDRSSRDRRNTGNPVIINVSYGALGGGHDGTSILEQAMRELVDSVVPQTFWLVLAAGNGHQASAHSSVDMLPGDSKELLWRVGPDNPMESYLEIWLPDIDVVHDRPTPSSAAEQIGVEVRSPDGKHVVYARVGDVWEASAEGSGPEARPVAALVYARRVVQSTRGTMILLAVAPTSVGGGRGTPSPHGEWCVTLHWVAQRVSTGPTLCIHAWTERNDLLFGVPRGQQSKVFADEPTGEPSEADPEARAAWQAAQANPALLHDAHGVRPRYTMSSLSGGRPARDRFALSTSNRGEIVVVGAHRALDGEASAVSSGGPSRLTSRGQERDAESGAPLNRSSQGPTQRLRPDASAPGELSPAVAGLRTTGFQSGVQARISATSAAAAQVTRAIANVQYVLTIDPSRQKRAEEQLFSQPTASPGEPGRPTLTPRSDDAYRRSQTQIP